MPFIKDSRKLHFARRVISLLLALCMTMTLWPMAALAEGEGTTGSATQEPPGPQATRQVSFRVRCSNNATGTVSYRFGDTGDFNFIDVIGTNETSVDIPTGATSITIKAVPTNGYYIHQDNSGVYTNGNRTTKFEFAVLTGDGFKYTFPDDSTVPQFQIEFDNNPGTSGGEGGGGGGGTGGGEGGGEGTETYQVDFQSGSWTVGEVTVTADKSGTIAALAKDAVITLTNFNADTMAVKLAASDGFNTTLTVTDGKTSLSARSGEGGLPATLVFSVVAKSDAPAPGPEPNPPHGGYTGTRFTSSLTISGEADFCINDSTIIGTHDESVPTQLDYTYDEKGNVDFYISCHINRRYTSFKVNGEEYVSQLPTPDTEGGREALLDACKGQLNEFKITVPYSDTYTIESSIKDLDESDKDYMVVGNFLWTYLEEYSQTDDYLDHGRMELLGVQFNGTNYSQEQLNNPGSGLDWSQNDNGGSAVLPSGAVVTVRLVPDYGYQLTSFGINGGNFGTGDAQSTFTFEIKPGNAHLGAHFTAVADKVASNTEAVSGGSITLGEGEIDTGSVVLSVDNAQNANEGGFQNAVEQEAGTPGYEVASVVDINLNQVVYKGNTNENDVWSNEMNTLKSDAEITLNVGGGYNDPVIVHEKHDGTYEVLDTTYDAEAGTITFQTDSFSHYAIAVKNACEAGLQGLTDEAISNMLSEPEKERVRNGEIVKVWLTAADLTDPLPTDEQHLIDSAKGNATVGLYLDICLMKQIGITPRDYIIETGTPVTVTLRVPDSLINTNAAVTRTYQIIRLHEGTVTVLPCTYDPATKTLSFQSSQFSIYALAYVDQQPPAQDSHPDSDTPEATPAPTPVKRSTIPQTGDAGAPALWFLLALAGGLGMVWCGKKRFRRQ